MTSMSNRSNESSEEVIKLHYEEVDQLRCYLQCAVLLEDDFSDELEHNYEPLDFDSVEAIGRPNVRFNVGIDSFEFFENMKPFMKIIQPEMMVSQINDFFANVDSTPERSTDRLLLLLKFLEMIPMDSDTTTKVNFYMLMYTYALYLLAIKQQ